MEQLTFGEQVKIILSRKGMTIKELAEKVEAYTGKNMSRQNMTQRLGRDNFQEKDMRLIAEILGCKFQLNIMEPATGEVIEELVEEPAVEPTVVEAQPKAEFKSFVAVKKASEPQKKETKEEPAGEINPYTGKEYETNSVRMHPKRIGYVQVYDRDKHGWTEMTEWAFLGYQERQKMSQGKDYKPPIYLD